MSVSRSRRFAELDSLRGLAALTVVLSHFHDMWAPEHASLSRWQRALFAAGRPLYAGHEAVMLFFLLSGLVLAMPYLAHRTQSYGHFAVRRVVRIYLPYLAALALTLTGVSLWHTGVGQGAWSAATWSKPIEAKLVFEHVLFLGVYDWHQYNPVIWSLIYEMRVSLLFPALIWVVMRLTNRAALLLALADSAIALVALRDGSEPLYSVLTTLHYSGFFIAGIVLARNLGVIAQRYRSLSRARRTALLSLSFFLYTQGWRVEPVIAHMWPALHAAFIPAEWLTVAGAAGYIVTTLNMPAVSRWLNRQFPLYLGRISYSLYLVHLAVLFALTYLLKDRITPWLQLPIFLAASFAVASIFHAMFESPSIRLSHNLSNREDRPAGVCSGNAIGSRYN